MPYEITADQEARLIVLTLDHVVSLTTFEDITTDLKTVQIDNPLSNVLILDVSALGMLPIGQQATSYVQRYTDRWHFDYLLVVGSSKLTRLMLMLIFNTVNMHFFSALDEAYAFAATIPRARR